MGTITPDYALTSSDLTLEMTGHLFVPTDSYFCLFNKEYVTDITVHNTKPETVAGVEYATMVSCPGPKTLYNST